MRWITDPSHGWLEVTCRDLADVGAAIDDFSDYSYIARKHETLYLEEDCDAPKFISRHPQRHTDFFRTLPELYIDTMADHGNMVRRCPRLGDLKIPR